MFTYKIYMHGNGNLWLRLRSRREKSEISLGQKATEEEFVLATNTAKGRKSRLGVFLQTVEMALKKVASGLTLSGDLSPDVKKVRDLFEVEMGMKAGDGGEFVKTYTSFMESRVAEGTRGVYKHTLNRVRAFDPDIDRKSFDEVTFQWLTDFEAFCAKTASKNARNIHLRNIRAVFNCAINNEITAAYPFRRFKIRSEATRKRSLTVEELREVFNCPVEPYAEIYRDMFKLIFMLCGINTVDLHGLKLITKGRVEYKRAKTGRQYSIKVEPEAMEIIKKYQGTNGLLCIADRWSGHRAFRSQMNKALQLIGAPRKGRGGKKGEGRWPELTTYWARHTWATIARKIGVSLDDIALALGHSDGRHETTLIYIDDTEIREAVDKANRRVLDWVLYGKS